MYLENYFKKVKKEDFNLNAISFLSAIDSISKVSKNISDSIIQELKDQRSNLKLIASENYSSLNVQQAMGNLLTDKYAEGFVKHRFYAGCDNIDNIEEIAVNEAKALFNAEHAYVQPHSGSDANLVAFWSILVHKIQNREIEKLNKKTLLELTEEEYEKVRTLLVNQKILGMSLGSGGHLTHGYRLNVSSKMMRAYAYDVDPKTYLLDYKEIEKKAKEVKPLILLAGYSAYPGKINFAKMKEIADGVNAVLMVDMAHFAGLVAGKVYTGEYDPVKYADIVTSTTHKTLRGPRGGIILCKDEYKEVIDKGCPILLGGPLPHVMAAKAIAFKEANRKSFQDYASQIVKNAKVLAEELVKLKMNVLTNKTENHLVMLDVFKTFNLTGKMAEAVLRDANITVNRNPILNDVNGAWFTSGIRIGTPALTTLNMKENEMKEIAKIIFDDLKNAKAKVVNEKPSKTIAYLEEKILKENQNKVKILLSNFKLYPELIIE